MAEADWQTPAIRDLIRTIRACESPRELAAFLRDVATIRELTEMAARWQATQLVDAGVPYREIAEQTSLSTATITRVAEWLRSGMGGYRAALRRLKSSKK